MDASTHANRKGEAKKEHGSGQERGRDDLREEGGAKGRYEGGSDADQPRRAHQEPGQRHGRDPADSPPGKVAGRLEEEE